MSEPLIHFLIRFRPAFITYDDATSPCLPQTRHILGRTKVYYGTLKTLALQPLIFEMLGEDYFPS